MMDQCKKVVFFSNTQSSFASVWTSLPTSATIRTASLYHWSLMIRDQDKRVYGKSRIWTKTWKNWVSGPNLWPIFLQTLESLAQSLWPPFSGCPSPPGTSWRGPSSFGLLKTSPCPPDRGGVDTFWPGLQPSGDRREVESWRFPGMVSGHKLNCIYFLSKPRGPINR